MPDGDVLRVLERDALDADPRFPLDPQWPCRACRDDQLAPVDVAVEPDGAAAVPKCGHCRGKLHFILNADGRDVRLGTQRTHQHEHDESCKQTA